LLLSTFVADAHTVRAHAWLRAAPDSLMVADLARLEFADVLSRAVRSGRFTKADYDRLLRRFDAFCARQAAYSHEADDFLDAERFVRDLSTKLSAPDALHLASARKAGAALATFDRRLAEAAKAAAVAVEALA
jgi:predicted nucleic acid-binding protein